MEKPLYQSVSFNAAEAVQQGLFVQAAYAMDNGGNGGLTPQPKSIPASYQMIAWVQMQDAPLFGRASSQDWKFYGLIAQHASNKNDVVLAIRGVDGSQELVNALSAITAKSWSWKGAVAKNFLDIYTTMRLVECHTGRVEAAEIEGGESFAAQVSSLISRHGAAEPGTRVRVVGHSLGAALATLFVAETQARMEAGAHHSQTYSLCTFASPRVGNGVFASAFNKLGLTSWRVANPLDLVTHLPPWLPIFEFTHIDELTALDARSIKLDVVCEHSLSTYLGLLVPSQNVEPACLAVRGFQTAVQS